MVTNEHGRDEYRSQLVEAELSSQTAYDRTVLTLSGGALGLSLTFLDRLLGEDEASAIGLLWIAWTFWAISLTIVLTSHYSSTLAMRKAVLQWDEGKSRDENPGGVWDRVIAVLNPAGGASFLVGVVAMVVFAVLNVE